MKSKPVKTPPAEHAADWPKRKHAQQFVERAQLGRFKFVRVAARALVLHPNHVWQQALPVPIGSIHFASLSRASLR
jgi:hypothetical protein